MLNASGAIVMTVLCVAEAVIVVGATIYIFRRWTIKQVPGFITLQMILLNLYWICLWAYEGILIKKAVSEHKNASQTFYMNLIVTFGDLFLIVHDWLFTYRILEASLMMPIVMSRVNDSKGDVEQRKTKQVRCWLHLTNGGFFIGAFAWFLVSAISGMLSGMIVIGQLAS